MRARLVLSSMKSAQSYCKVGGERTYGAAERWHLLDERDSSAFRRHLLFSLALSTIARLIDEHYVFTVNLNAAVVDTAWARCGWCMNFEMFQPRHLQISLDRTSLSRHSVSQPRGYLPSLHRLRNGSFEDSSVIHLLNFSYYCSHYCSDADHRGSSPFSCSQDGRSKATSTLRPT
jgi:hypothetical protein